MRYIWLALFCLFLGIASFLAEDIFFPVRPPFPDGSFELAIHKDFQKLESSKELPIELQNIKSVYFLDHRSKPENLNWVELSNLHFPQSQNGRYELQIEAFDTGPKDKESNQEVIFQFGLFDSTTKNKIWEISRSFPITKYQRHF